VKAPQTPPVINTVDAEAIRFAAKYGWGNPPYFQIPKWVFSGVNGSLPIIDFPLNCENVTRDIRGLCAGDVNGSYLPTNGYKTVEPSLELVNRGTLPVTPEIVFPVRAERDMELGAITLMLDYDPALIEITGVTMPDDGGVEPWFEVQGSKFKVAGTLNLEPGTLNLEPGTLNLEPGTLNLEPGTLNILQIGWASLNPINVSHDETVLLIHARPSSLVLRASSLVLRFTLNPSPLSELADGNGDILYDARLSIADAGGMVQGSRFKVEAGVVVYPNPAKNVLNVEFVTDNVDARTCHGMSLQLFTMQGIVVVKHNLTEVKTGLNKTTMDVSKLPNGAYMLRFESVESSSVVKVIIQR
jgi:hypothetical protein